MASQPAKRFYRMNDFLMVVGKGDEFQAAECIVSKLRMMKRCGRGAKGYVFLNAERQLFFFDLDHNNLQYFFTNYEKFLVGFYTGNVSVFDIAEDIASM